MGGREGRRKASRQLLVYTGLLFVGLSLEIDTFLVFDIIVLIVSLAVTRLRSNW